MEHCPQICLISRGRKMVQKETPVMVAFLLARSSPLRLALATLPLGLQDEEVDEALGRLVRFSGSIGWAGPCWPCWSGWPEPGACWGAGPYYPVAVRARWTRLTLHVYWVNLPSFAGVGGLLGWNLHLMDDKKHEITYYQKIPHITTYYQK